MAKRLKTVNQYREDKGWQPLTWPEGESLVKDEHDYQGYGDVNLLDYIDMSKLWVEIESLLQAAGYLKLDVENVSSADAKLLLEGLQSLMARLTLRAESNEEEGR